MNLNENISRLKELMGLITEVDIKSNALEGVDPKLVSIFKKIENEFGSPLQIKFGYRDPKQNISAGGASKSAHLTGKALDIKFDSPNREGIKRLISLASKHGVLGIGVYRDAEDIHIDIDETKGRRAWGPSYSSDSIPTWAKAEIDQHLKKK